MATSILLLALCVGLVAGHGRLLEPPSRGSMWRFGFKNPPNYDDNQIWCGGFGAQKAAGYKCGVCGDAYKGPRPHEAGGKYANGIITRTYKSRQVILVTVELTANHKGWFEFRMCPNNNPKKKITHECLNRHLMELADGSGTRFRVTSNMRKVHIKLRLPKNIDSCSQCVLQWQYHTGHNIGRDPVTGRSCLGCGMQEEFYGCSDVAITSSGVPTAKQTEPTVKATTRGRQTTTTKPTDASTRRPTTARATTPAPRATRPKTTFKPTVLTTLKSTVRTTLKPTERPTLKPTERPTPKPTDRPTLKPTVRQTFKPTVRPTPKPTERPTPKPTERPTLKPTVRTLRPSSHDYCRAIGVWANIKGFHKWCRNNCRAGHCPRTHCSCRKP